MEVSNVHISPGITFLGILYSSKALKKDANHGGGGGGPTVSNHAVFAKFFPLLF